MKSIHLVRALFTIVWMFPPIIIMGIFNHNKADKIGIIYRDVVKGLAEL